MAFDLKKFLQGAVAQVNPFDGGQNFASVQRSAPPPPASTARPSLTQQVTNAARSVASTRIPILGVSANEIGAQLPHAVDTTLSHVPLLSDAYSFGKQSATPSFQNQSL